jgi:5'-3' exonuclease
MPTVHLIDASLYVFRAWHGLPATFHDIDGAPVHAVYGYTRFLCEFLERTQPTHAAVAFDESLTHSFRNDLYPAYKANRESPPVELARQFDYCKQLTEAFGLQVLRHSRYEADDLIGSVVARLRPQGFRAVIVSADKDFGQLLAADDEQWDFARDQRWGPAGVAQRLGVYPEQVVDFLALCGDGVDNIPGVPGIGPKTAAALLRHFGDLESLMDRVEQVPGLPLRGAAQAYARLREYGDQARLSRTLATIERNAPVPDSAESLRWSMPDPSALEGLLDRLRFDSEIRARCRKLAR